MRCVALALMIAAAPAGAQEIYDLLIRNGRVIDPANRRNGRFDIAVVGNKIARVAADLPAAQARVVVDASRYYVTPGLIDIAAHYDQLNADHNSLRAGVTTAVDAGGAGTKGFELFQTRAIGRARVRLLEFLRCDDAPEAVARVAQKYPQIVVGIRAGEDAAAAIKAAELSRTIVMLDDPSEGNLKSMRRGDIVTHCYGLKTGTSAWEARKRGVLVDVGHGSAGFWFRIAAPAIRQGLLPDTISTDIDRESIMLPRADMANTLSKLLNLGMTVEQLIERTTVNPARALRRPELGSLSEGAVADIAVMEEQKGTFAFLDSGHGKLMGDRRLRCVLTVRNGEVLWDSDGLSQTDWRKAGPYSNFR